MKANQMTSENLDYSNEKLTLSEFSFSKKERIKDNPLISIVIPMYNEEHSIKKVIKKIPNHGSYEIIVIDDGSTDNSVRKIKEVKDRAIKVIRHEKNQGYGAAILSGFENVTGDIIITMDSDGQHNPEEIPNLIEPIINDQVDIVVGSRYLGRSNYKIPLYTLVGEYFIYLCLRFLYHQKVRNNQGGFRAFRKETVKIFNNLKSNGMGFTTELLFKAAHKNLRITEIPIILNSREVGISYVSLIRVLKSVSLCILYYTIKKFNLNVNLTFLRKILNYINKKFRRFKFFQH